MVTPDNDLDATPPKGVQAVDRAISVLELLARDGEAGVSEVAAEIGVHKSTAFRLLGALEVRELVEQNDSRGKYRLSHGLLRLASAVPARQDLTHQAQPICDALAAEVGETVNVAVARSGFSVNLVQAAGPSTVGTIDWLGSLTPLHATSSGKVLLAHLDPGEAEHLIDRVGLERFTERTITDPALLRSELATIAQDGYARTFEEFEEGLNSVAAPIRDYTGAVIAGISASGPVYRFSRERIDEVIPMVIAAAEQISHRMGYSRRSA
ncbi:IclR family transcriptional regulator [Tsukamurella asaccharolytica]|uniref:Glycerol operon regulatory protein n=1 Tax=Tsukamurella asaccharolytica TaxID=2592067 RepID=A0A5C5R6J0_9ACTN|nr:IclR family transcriptional regulator [Tsukamurella asaccharolytica]TWS17943.1 IclR family transcriptional regulator [Tsukamurella asaccharolytica]